MPGGAAGGSGADVCRGEPLKMVLRPHTPASYRGMTTRPPLGSERSARVRRTRGGKTELPSNGLTSSAPGATAPCFSRGCSGRGRHIPGDTGWTWEGLVAPLRSPGCPCNPAGMDLGGARAAAPASLAVSVTGLRPVRKRSPAAGRLPRCPGLWPPCPGWHSPDIISAT